MIKASLLFYSQRGQFAEINVIINLGLKRCHLARGSKRLKCPQTRRKAADFFQDNLASF